MRDPLTPLYQNPDLVSHELVQEVFRNLRDLGARRDSVGIDFNRLADWVSAKGGYTVPRSVFFPTDYRTFHDWFLRTPTPETLLASRKMAQHADLCSPAEGKIEYTGRVGDGLIELKQGRANVLEALKFLEPSVGGHKFIKMSLYLHDCHRVYAPIGGVVQGVYRFASDTDPFGRNNVTVIQLGTRFGRVFLCCIGEKTIQDFQCSVAVGDTVRAVDEVGRFEWGSMILVVYPPDLDFVFDETDHPVFIGDPIAVHPDHPGHGEFRYPRVEPVKMASRQVTADVPEKYKHIDFKPPQSVADAAEKGLEYREKASPSQKGGLTPAEAAKQGIGSGVQRAVNLKNRDNISPDTIKQMTAFFSRHEKNKGVAPEHKGEPWNDKGNVSWLIWGGDPGRAWAEKVKKQMETADEKAKKTASVGVEFSPLALNFLAVQKARVTSDKFATALTRFLKELLFLSKSLGVPPGELQRAGSLVNDALAFSPPQLKPGKFSASGHALDLAEDAYQEGDLSAFTRRLAGVLGALRMEVIESGFAPVFSPLSESLLKASADFAAARKTADLSPPLGVNGGPCKVVERINNAIRNPGLREDLVEDAETGHLTNQDARKVYPLTTESGSGFKSFTILPHAQFRMDYRSITVRDVAGALNSFIAYAQGLQQRDPREYEALLSQDKIEWVDPKTRLKVVFATDNGRVEVVTVFWKGRQDPPPASCEEPLMRTASVRRVVAQHTKAPDPLEVIAGDVETLEALASDIQAVLDTYAETVPMPIVGRIAALTLHSQTEVFTKSEHAMRHAERVIAHCRTYLVQHPGDATVSMALRDAQMLYERFEAFRAQAREVLSALSQKIMPKDLRLISTEALETVRGALNYPNSVSVTVHPHFAPAKLGDRTVDAMVFDVYLTAYPLPEHVEAGLPEYQQFLLTQSTLGDTAVYLTVIDRTNENAPSKPVKVTSGAAAAKKILAALDGWPNLV